MRSFRPLSRRISPEPPQDPSSVAERTGVRFGGAGGDEENQRADGSGRKRQNG